MRGQRIPRTSKVIIRTLFMSSSVNMYMGKGGGALLEDDFFFNRIATFTFPNTLVLPFLASCVSLLQTPSPAFGFLFFFGQPKKVKAAGAAAAAATPGL